MSRLASGALRSLSHFATLTPSTLRLASLVSILSDRNVEEILRLLSFRSSYNDVAASGSTSVNSESKMALFKKYASRGLLDSEKVVKNLKENALRCVEAIGCLTQEVQIDGFMFDVEKTRLHFVAKFVEFLARDELLRPVELQSSWDTSVSNSSLGSRVSKAIATSVIAEKDQLKKVRKSASEANRLGAGGAGKQWPTVW